MFSNCTLIVSLSWYLSWRSYAYCFLYWYCTLSYFYLNLHLVFFISLSCQLYLYYIIHCFFKVNALFHRYIDTLLFWHRYCIVPPSIKYEFYFITMVCFLVSELLLCVLLCHCWLPCVYYLLTTAGLLRHYFTDCLFALLLYVCTHDLLPIKYWRIIYGFWLI